MSNIYNGSFFTKTQHSPTEAAILDALNTFGCIATEQIKSFCPPIKTVTEDYILKVCQHLTHSKQANLINDDKYLVKRGVNAPDESAVLSIWAYLDLLKNKEVYNLYRNCPKAKYPSIISYFSEKNELISIIPITGSGDISKIMLENENFAGYPNNGLSRQYVLVFREMELVNELSKFKPNFPFKVAVASGSLDQPMNIKYYEIG